MILVSLTGSRQTPLFNGNFPLWLPQTCGSVGHLANPVSHIESQTHPDQGRISEHICESDGAVPCEQREPEVAPLRCAMQTRSRQGRRWWGMLTKTPKHLSSEFRKTSGNKTGIIPFVICVQAQSSGRASPTPIPHDTPAHTSSLTKPHSETPQLSQAENDLNLFWHLSPPHRVPQGVT